MRKECIYYLIILFTFCCSGCSSGGGAKNNDEELSTEIKINQDPLTTYINKDPTIKNYKKISIPIGKEEGIKLYKNSYDELLLEGFEVDENGLLYFLSGDNATADLTCFSLNNLLFRKQHSDFSPNQLHLYKDTLYTLNQKHSGNDLFLINKGNGEIIKKYENFITNRLNSFIFRDSTIVVWLFDKKDKVTMNTKYSFGLFDLSGNFLKEVDNQFNIPKAQYEKFCEDSLYYSFVGKWKNHMIYYNVRTETYGNEDHTTWTSYDQFILTDSLGTVISKFEEHAKDFGNQFYEAPLEHQKIRNESLFIVRHDNKNVIITELPLKEIFEKNN